MCHIGPGGQHPTAFAPGTHVRVTHTSGHPLARDASPLILQLSIDTRTPISASMRNKDLPNLLRKLSIFSLARACRTLAPGRKATFRDSKHLAHGHDGQFLLVLFN